MDMHRSSPIGNIDPQPGSSCEFCRRLDPLFEKRHPLDQLVRVKCNQIASAHLTEGRPRRAPARRAHYENPRPPPGAAHKSEGNHCGVTGQGWRLVSCAVTTSARAAEIN
jgi:hypothetical protein